MAPPTKYDEAFYEGNQEKDWKSNLPRLFLLVVLVHVLSWATLFITVGPPEEHLMLYAIVPVIIFLIAMVGGFCTFSPA